MSLVGAYMFLGPLHTTMRVEGERLRAVRHTFVALANGASLLFLAVLVAAYGSETAIPFASVEEFLRVASVWARGPREPTLAWALGYLGVAVAVLSPLWFLLVSPAVRGLLDLEFSTAPAERREETRESDEKGAEATRPTRIDGTGVRFVRGGAAGGEVKKFTPENASGEAESDPSGRDD